MQISLIIPVYKNITFLDMIIESLKIISKNFKAKIELIQKPKLFEEIDR